MFKIAEAIEVCKPDIMLGEVTIDQVRLIVGDVANIWPASIKADVDDMRRRGMLD